MFIVEKVSRLGRSAGPFLITPEKLSQQVLTKAFFHRIVVMMGKVSKLGSSEPGIFYAHLSNTCVSDLTNTI